MEAEYNLAYTLEKFELAVTDMAISHGSLQERLYGAFLAHLGVLVAEDFPPDLRGRFKKLDEQSSRVTAFAGEGDYRATFDRMSDDEASEMARGIMFLHDRLTDHLDDPAGRD